MISSLKRILHLQYGTAYAQEKKRRLHTEHGAAAPSKQWPTLSEA